jgi:ubiquinone/menaquinone biosynthesis C-methylase UbiE
MDYQDMLARLGEGSAHPGGFTATLGFLSNHPMKPGSRILEVGCGTGRTACHLASMGYDVVAVDNKPGMLRKAKKRAELQHVHVQFEEGDACSIPLESQQFDIVFIESATIFTDVKLAVKEYCRVLRPGGQLLDREIFVRNKNKTFERAMCNLYGIIHVPTFQQWMSWFKNASFSHVEFTKRNSDAINMEYSMEGQNPDPFRMIDYDILGDPAIPGMIKKNQEIADNYAKFLDHGVFIAIK